MVQHGCFQEMEPRLQPNGKAGSMQSDASFQQEIQWRSHTIVCHMKGFMW